MMRTTDVVIAFFFTYEEREGLLEFGDLFLGERVGLWCSWVSLMCLVIFTGCVPLKTAQGNARQRGVKKKRGKPA